MGKLLTGYPQATAERPGWPGNHARAACTRAPPGRHRRPVIWRAASLTVALGLGREPSGAATSTQSPLATVWTSAKR
jgi:hypothetical protein